MDTFALAHNDKRRTFENSHTNIQTDTNQNQNCESAGETSPITNSCTASSSNTITESGGSITQGTSNQCTTMHPTVLTLSISPNPSIPGQIVLLTGTLTDACTGSGVSGATITFTGTLFIQGHPPD